MAGSNLTPYKHIQRIRGEKFGLSRNGRSKSTNSLARDLHAATENLAQGLYSRDIHFIMELIQNAEDNSYDSSVVPALELRLLDVDPTSTPGAEGALLLINNEVGFSDRDVEALCSIGSTTKDKQMGFIGEKGIGFKSVFVVSTQPYLFSKGYRFHFSEQPDREAGLGYIVPYWVNDIPDEVRVNHRKTCILLPLRAEKRASVEAELSMIAPELLLFLRKLSSLTVGALSEALHLVRDDNRRPLVTLLVGQNSRQYYLYEREYTVVADVIEEKRVGVLSRTISIALPLSEATPPQSVFAYLPTDVASGFPFLLNADFILSASRESIQVDRPWNTWLRDCLGPAFVEAFLSMLRDPDLRFRPYAFIPLQSGTAFFEPVREHIIQALRESAVVWPCIGDEPVPSAEVCTTPTGFRALLDYEHLPEPLRHRPPVHADIAGYAQQLNAIGVKDMTQQEMEACLRDEAWLDLQSPEWYARLYGYLAGRTSQHTSALDDIPLLLTHDGSRWSATKGVVCFPGSDSILSKDLFSQASQPALSRHLHFLHPSVYELIREDKAVVSFLHDTLGVSEPTPGRLCVAIANSLRHHATDIAMQELCEATAFICKSFASLAPDVQKEIRDALPLGLADGSILERSALETDRPLVMQESMDPEDGWQLVFPESDDREHMAVLSDDYLRLNAIDRETWRSFWLSMGATLYPPPRQGLWHWYDRLPEGLPPAARAFYIANATSSTRGHQIMDWRAPSWLRLPQGEEPSPIALGRANALVHWLDGLIKLRGSFWYARARYGYHYYSWSYRDFRSEIEECLVSRAWVPSSVGLRRPSEIFADRLEIRDVFGDRVAYAPEGMSEQTRRFLGIRETATSGDLLDYLSELSSQDPSGVDKEVVRRIYRRLNASDTPIDELKAKVAILVDAPTPKWVAPGECAWQDLSDAFGDLFCYLSSQYDESLRPFFVGKLGIRAQIDDEAYADAWSKWSRSSNPSPDKVKAAMEVLFPRLSRVAASNEPPDWWPEFCRDALVWTQSDHFVPAGKAFIPDDAELRRCFSGKVEFAWRPEKDSFRDHHTLYAALGVRSLADSVNVFANEIAEGEKSVDPAYLTEAAKKGLLLWLCSEQPSQYQRLKREGLLEAYLATSEIELEDVSVTMRLDDHEITLGQQAALWHPTSRTLYMSSTAGSELEGEIAISVARRLAAGEAARRIEDMLDRLLGADADKVESLAQHHNWRFPPEEEEWVSTCMGYDARSDVQEESLGQVEPGSEESGGSPPEQPRAVQGAGGSTATRQTATRRARRRAHQRYPLGVTVEPDMEVAEVQTAEQREQIMRVDRAGISRVLAFEHENERVPSEMPHTNPGYDIESHGPGDMIRYIEVKSLSGEWQPSNLPALTATQFDMAQELGHEFWLYVVEYALDDDAWQIYCLRNPFNDVGRFLFDAKWKEFGQCTSGDRHGAP